MSKEERNEIINNVAFSLIKGAVALQFVGNQDFYHKSEDDDLEILIRSKKDYKEIKKEEIAWNLMKDVILVLEQEKHQFERIATSYEGN